MSQALNESLNSIGSEDHDDTRDDDANGSDSGSGSGSGSSSGSDSDSDSSSSSDGESSDGISSPEPPEDGNDSVPTKTDATKASTTVAGFPPNAIDAQQEDTKTNGFSDENDSDSDSSGSNSVEDNDDEGPAKNKTQNERNTSLNTTSETTDNNNTSNTTDDDDDEEDADMDRDDNEAGGERSESAESDPKSEASESPSANESGSTSSSSSDEDDEEDYKPKRPTRQARKAPAEKTRKPAKKKKKQNWDSDESDGSEGDSDESMQHRRKAPAKSTKSQTQSQRRRVKSSYSSEESEEEGKRCATRRKAAAVSYKEATEDEQTDSEDLLEADYDESQAAAAALSEEDKSETIERILAKRQGKRGCTGNQTTIYAIEESGCDPNEGVDEHDIQSTELQYLIKWKGWSHIHNTWESEATLREQKVKGMKKLDNFIKKEQDTDYWRRYAGPEDIDYFECQQELQNDLQKSYNNVDRIIAREEKPDGSSEYLCKWQSLPYSEATWEDSGLVCRKWKRYVELFEERENSKCTPSRHCKVLKYRPKFYKIKGQPEFLCEGLSLRDYQLDGLNWLLHSWCKENSVILADEMGLGKTIQTICFLYSMFKVHHLYGPFLCVVPLSTMTAWQREFDLWAPEMNVVTYLGDVKSREMIRQYEWQFDKSKRLKYNCILTTYEIVLKDKLFLGTLQWAALLVDEAHRLKNDDSLLYKSLKEFETNHRLLITGTPLQNSLKELWALLHFIMPEKFVTWEDFELEHGNAADKGYMRLHQQLEPYILRRVKKDVEKSLPAKVEQILRVEMTACQKQYYKWILTKNFDALRKGKKGSTSTFLNIVIELKKCCNHAALIRPSEFELMGLPQEEALQTLLRGSGKLVLLDKLLCRLKETGHRVLIFSQMVRMLDVLADYLQKRHFPFQRLDGSIKGEMRRQALDHFNAEGSQDFCFLLSTRAGGLGINLATADTVIIFDSDWNPQNDLQAQARAHRIGQKNQVNIYRLVTARSVEEQIVERAKQKMVLDHLVIQRMDTTGRTVLDKSAGGASSNTTPFNKDDLSAILKFGAEELFKDEQENDDELVCDIDEILRRAETRNEDPEMPGDDLLSAFKVASIAAFDEEPSETPKPQTDNADDEDDTKDWDDIIPEDFRKIVENQERAKEMEDLYLPPRRKTTANNQSESPMKRGKGGKTKPAYDSGGDSDYEVGSDGSGEEGRGPRKRGRPAMKEKINGFTDAEIRRFIRSYKKFPAPLMRLEAIACDAELQEKPLAELKRVGEMLHDRCVQFIEEHKEEETKTAVGGGGAGAGVATNEENGKQRRPRATYSVKLGGVSFNAKTLLACEEELKPLNEIMPSTAAERLNWTFNIKTRPTNFDVDWGIEEDSKLLCGIYQYGIGSWEQMKIDPTLKLTEKILLNDTRKPQGKHLQSRAEYLLKIIKKNVELKKGEQRKQRKPRKPREAKATAAGSAAAAGTPERKSRNHLSESHATGDDASQMGDSLDTRKSRNKDGGALKQESHDVETAGGQHEGDAAVNTKKKVKRNETNKHGKGSRARKTSAADNTNKPMHFTANNEPRALEVLGDLDPNIFNECKEKMRPVKKALKALDRPDSSLSNQEQVRHTRECLLLIGKQIDTCLKAYKEPEKKEWRSNLWYFVSKFTEFDAKKLFKIYKHTLKSSEEEPAASAGGDRNANIEKMEENGGGGRHDKDRDKSGKKKKKDKERDRDKVQTNSERFGGGGGSAGSSGSGEKSRRFGIDSPIKRKRDENDLGVGGNDMKSTSYKRLNMDSRNHDERKKHHRDDYYAGSGGGGGYDASGRRNSLNSPSTTSNRPGMSNARLPPGNAGYTPTSGAGASPYMDGGDRWGHGGGGRDRYSNDYKRDRYESYNRSGGYNRERDRERRPDKRRYPPPAHLPPHAYAGHYLPNHMHYMANGAIPGGGLSHVYRNDPRYAPSADWQPRDYPSDYRRSDYDRRQQT